METLADYPLEFALCDSRGGRTRDRRVFSSFLFSLSVLVLPLLVLPLVRSVKQKGGWWETMVFNLCSCVVFISCLRVSGRHTRATEV